jgi:hypothetical protein
VTLQPYEQSLLATPDPGNTAYDAMFPLVGAPTIKGTDTDLVPEPERSPYVKWTELDYEVGGETGEANRNAYVLGGIPVTYDAHDFRGDHAHIPVHFPYGAYGDVGENSDDHPTQYAHGIAANAYPEVTTEQSWDAISQGY